MTSLAATAAQNNTSLPPLPRRLSDESVTPAAIPQQRPAERRKGSRGSAGAGLAVLQEQENQEHPSSSKDRSEESYDTKSMGRGFSTSKRGSRKIAPSKHSPSQEDITINNISERSRLLTSMPTVSGVGVAVDSLGRGPQRASSAGISVPDVTRSDFVIGGPGIGTSCTNSSASDAAESRRESMQFGSGGTTGGPSRSANSSRRPTFQGKSALMIAVQKRMSAVDMTQVGAGPGSGRETNDVAPFGSDDSFVTGPSEKPTILMYPRKEVMISNSGSMNNVSSRSRHGSTVSLRKPTGSRSGSLSNAARTGSVQFADPKRAGSVGGIPGGKGSAFNMMRPGLSSKTGLAGSVSMGALAAAGSARASQARRDAQENGGSGSGSRQGSGSFVPATFGSAPAGSSALSGSKRSSLRPPSDGQLPEDAGDLKDSPVTMKTSGTKTTSFSGLAPTEHAYNPPPAVHSPAFDRPQSVIGEIDDAYRSNPEYYEYLMLCQRHASSNFIHKIDSSEVVWKTESTKVKMIGRYLLGDQIGKGAFGKVKEGLCSETLQRVAVKILNKKRLRKMQGGIEAAIREIKLLRRLKHRNAIKLIDVYCKVEDEEGSVGVFNWFSTIEEEPIAWKFEDGTEDDRDVQILKWYLIFEYCPCSLQTLLEQEEGNMLPLARAHWFFVQLIEGLSYLHSQGVIHRDIKAGNMLITPDNTLKISDFGIAEQFSTYSDADMDVTSFAGTHQFLSPELAEGVPNSLGEPVDVWACGITLYNMLTGRYPFEFDEDGNLLVLYEKIMAAEFDMPVDFDEDLQDLLLGMLDRNPETRYTTSQILLHPWTRRHHWVVQPPVLLYPISADSPTTPSSTKGISPMSPRPQTPGGGGSNRSPTSGKPVIHTHKHITPCETTLIPYLDELYANEIEQELARDGKIEDLAGVLTDLGMCRTCRPV
ncbi:Serine/threonine-protein kinase stk11 [Thoreauomyces humboldtii]|nr:Serine/threonine-protein kinase stk11 [Thoreauomyces humboldtii]